MSAGERFERHGHLPAAFLVADAAIEPAERALFAAGFETIVLRGDSLKRESFFKVFELLYSAGFVVLAGADSLDFDVKKELQQRRGSRTVFDFSEDAKSELVSRILAHAHSLRLGTDAGKGE